MNFYAITAQYIVDIFKNDPLVNTIIFGAVDGRDLDKANIFPLVHIMPGNVTSDNNRIDIEFDIAIVDVRDTRYDSSEDKIFGDNLIDSLGQSAAIGIKSINIMKKRNTKDILLESSTSGQPIIFQDKNLLDGFEFSVVLSIQNTISGCQ